MNRKQFFGGLALVALGVGLAWVVSETFFDPHADRRFALYNVMRELLKGMSRNDVEAIVERQNAPFIRKYADGNSINLSVKPGGIDSSYLAIEFSDGKLIKAHFGGEDNPWDVPKDTPSKIE